MARRILVFGSGDELSRSIGRVLDGAGDRAEQAHRVREVSDRLAAGGYDALIAVASQLRGDHGIAASEAARDAAPDVPVVVVASDASAQTLLQALRAGAMDALIAPFQPGHLLSVLEQAVTKARDRDLARRLSSETPSAGARLDGLVGDGVAMRRIFSTLERSGSSDAAALFVGESGTGRETLARALHLRSRRRNGPFIVMPGSTARDETESLVAQARGGTIFLSGIDRWTGSFDALVAAARERDVRLMASVEPACAADWAARIPFSQGLRFDPPPLRERGDDIALIARVLIDRFAAANGPSVRGVVPEVIERLRSYPWPGNLDELTSVIAASVAHTAYDRITVDDLPSSLRARLPRLAQGPAVETMDEVERSHILSVLDAVGQNKTNAARLLGLDRKTLYRKLERYEAEGRLPQRRRPDRAA